MKLKLLICVFIMCCMFVKTEAMISETKVTSRKLDTTKKEKWNCSFETVKPTKSELLIYDKDMKIIRNIKGNIYRKKHSIEWNGKDNNGKKLPSQLYTYTIKTTDMNGVIFTKDNTLSSGGLDVLTYWPKWDMKNKKITFNLANNSLIKVKVMSQKGDLINTVANWIPVTKGLVKINWDGKNADKTKIYSNDSAIKIKVNAISLPSNYILLMSSEPMPKSFIDAKWISNAVIYNKKLNPTKISNALVATKIQKEKNIKMSLTTTNTTDKNGSFIPEKNKVHLEIKIFNLTDKKSSLHQGKIIYYLDGARIGEEIISGSKISLKHIIDTSRINMGIHNYVVNVVFGSGDVQSSSIKINKK